MFENEIKFICKHFQDVFYSYIREPIYQALTRYFGLSQKQITEAAITDLDNAFISGTGINKFEIVPIENGEMRVKYNLEFTIKTDYLGLIPVLANDLGYGIEIEPTTAPLIIDEVVIEPIVEEELL